MPSGEIMPRTSKMNVRVGVKTLGIRDSGTVSTSKRDLTCSVCRAAKTRE